MYYSSISVGFKIIEDRFGVRFVQPDSYQPVYSVSAFSFPPLPVITSDNPAEISFLTWGLIPSWVRDEETALSIRQRGLNARAETIFDKPMFRQSIISKRCLVLVDGFFEWRHVNGKTYPYRIRLIDHEPFAVAGIWDRWLDPASDDEIITFSVVTTEANDLMAQVHNTRKRMPVILPRESEKRWLDTSLGAVEIELMLRPHDASQMEAYPVDRSILKLGFNTTDPSVLNRKEYKGLSPL